MRSIVLVSAKTIGHGSKQRAGVLMNLYLRLVLSCSFLLPLTTPAQTLPAFLQSQIPAPGAEGVPTNTVILLRLQRVDGQGCYSLRLSRAGAADEYLSGYSGDSYDTYWELIFRPREPLLSSTQYTVVADCTAQSWKFQFTTGQGPDTEGPRLVSSSPDPASRDTNPFGPFLLRFSKPLMMARNSVTVLSGAGVTTGDASLRLTEDRQGIEIRPRFEYSIPPVVMLDLPAGSVRDLANNPSPGTGIKLRFLTSLVTDASGPQVLGMSPESGDASAPTNSAIQILFNRPVNLPSARDGGIVLETRGASVPFDVEASGALLRFSGVTLLPNTSYRVRITSKLLDANGIAVSQETSAEFTTSSSAEPDPTVATASGPPNLATPVNAQLVIRSSRRMPSFLPLMLSTVSLCGHNPNACAGQAVTAKLQEDRKTLVMIPKTPWPAWVSAYVDLSDLLDITGMQLNTSWGFTTTDQTDTEPPSLAASTPSDGDVDVPLNTVLRIVMNEPIGLMTPDSAVRLIRDGQAVEGSFRFVFSNDYRDPAVLAMEFTPAAALEPVSDYQVELVGIADLAGNVMADRRIHFRTAAGSTVPTPLKLVSSSLDYGRVGPHDPLVFEYTHPLKAGKISAGVTVEMAVPSSSSVQMAQPIRTEVTGSTVRITPLLAWPATRDLRLSLSGEDRWSRSFYQNITFHSEPAGDTDRPEVVSITPADGTPITAGQAIRVTFSKPMLDASQSNGGLSILRMEYSQQASIYWSADRTTATVVPYLLTAWPFTETTPVQLAVTSALLDLSGNPAKAFTARFPLIPSNGMGALAAIVKAWPRTDGSPIDIRATLALYLSAQVDANQFNRAVWVVTSNGRAAGLWRVSQDGRLATFQAEQPWPAGSPVRLMQLEPVLDLTYGFAFTTSSSSLRPLSVVQISMQDPHPANEVIDVEFNQDLPSGPGPLRLQSQIYGNFDYPYEELRPRPNVVRLAPRGVPATGDSLRVSVKPGSALAWSGWYGKVVPPADPLNVQLRYRSPLPGSTGVPLNARISAVFSGELNQVSVSAANVTLKSGGAILPATLVPTAQRDRLTIVPLAFPPANATVEVSLTGLEDRLGVAIPPIVWSFTTGNSIDITPPAIQYSNASSLVDPLSNVVITYDKPIDPAFIQQVFVSGQTIQWNLSPDLRSLYLLPDKGWNRGESYSLSPRVYDWSGNDFSGNSVNLRVGFETDRTPPVLRAVSVREGQAGLPLNAVFALLFNKPLGSEALRSVRLSSAGGDVQLLVKSSDGNRVTCRPASLLRPLTTYQLIVEGVQDGSGNTMDGRTVVSFVTGEILSEASITAKYRFDSAAAPLTIQFTQSVDITPLLDSPQLLRTTDSRGGQGSTVYLPIGVAWSDDRTLLTVTPRQPLLEGVTYTLTLNGLTGSGGGSVSPTEFSFTPGLVTELIPARVAIIPADGSTQVPLNAALQVAITGNRNVSPALRLFENGTQVNVNFTAYVGSYFVPGLTVLQRTLKPDMSYRIEVDGFTDALGNQVPPTTSTFTTGSAGSYNYLSLTSSSPASQEVGVSPDSPWTLSFNMPLVPVAFIERPQSSRAMPFSFSTQVQGNQLILAASPSWPAASTISLFMYPSRSGLPSVLSWTGSPLLSALGLSFRTAAINDPTPPVIESVEPPAGSILPGGKATVSIRFSKPVELPSNGLQVFYGADKASVSGYFSKDYRTITYPLLPPPDSRVTFAGTSDIRDNAGNSIAPFVLEYDTGETLPWGTPTAKLTEPAQMWSVPADTKFTVRFDRVMDSASVLTAIRVTENGQNTEGSIEVLEGGRSYRFYPAAPFRPGAAVKVFLLRTAQDPTGLPVYNNDWPVSLNVAGTSTTAAPPLELIRSGFLRTAPVDATLEFQLSADLDPSSVNSESVWLRQGKHLVGGQVTLRDGAVVQFRPSEPLQAGTDYVLTAGSALRDLEGMQFRGQDLFFQAVPSADSADLESVSETEWQGRPALRVRFTAPVSPLAANGLTLDFDGTPVSVEALSTTDPREFLLLPGAATGVGRLHVNLDRVPGANGRLLPFRRMAAGSRSVEK